MTNNKDKKVLNVPNLRFPEFTNEWGNITIKEACSEFQSGKNIKAEMITGQGLYPVYGGNGLRGFTESYNHDGDYILIGRQGALCGNIRKVTGKTYVTEHAIAVCASKENETTFLQYLFQKMKLGQYSDQSAQPGLAVNKLLRLNINVPSKIEQAKIAKILSLIDERIITQNKIIEKLESLIRGIRNSLLYSDNGTLIRIGDILKERAEKTTVNNQHEVLSSTVKGIFSQREYFSKDIASENNVGYKVIRLHDVVLSPQNLWMGNINYNDRFEVGIVSPSYKIFTIAEKYDKTFIASMLKTQRALYNYMLVSEQGASIVRRNLNMEAFEQLVFKIPPYEKQCEIGRTMSTLRTRLAIANAIKIAYGQQKRWLLRQMFI